MFQVPIALRRCGVLWVAGILALSLLSCGNEQNGAVEVINPRLVRTPDGSRAFTGTLVNTGTRPLSIAQLDVALYDKNGSTVETIRIEVQDIPAQDSVSFSSTIDSDRSFQQAQVKEIYTP